MPTVIAQHPTTYSFSNLNGRAGVKFIGENPNDYSGGSVSTTGDVNGDGIPDLLLGAADANNDAGLTYLVFGHSGIWTTPISLASLNEITGMKFLGENNEYSSGHAVSTAC